MSTLPLDREHVHPVFDKLYEECQAFLTELPTETLPRIEVTDDDNVSAGTGAAQAEMPAGSV